MTDAPEGTVPFFERDALRIPTSASFFERQLKKAEQATEDNVLGLALLLWFLRLITAGSKLSHGDHRQRILCHTEG